MLQIEVTVTGSKEIQQRLTKMGRDLYMLRSAMNAIGENLGKYYRDVGFASQGGVFGAKWPRLNPRYAAYKAKKYPGRSPLVRTGQMQRSFEYEADNNSVTIFNASPHFVYHQSSAPRVKIPRRASMGINNQVRATIGAIVQKEIQAKITRAGF